ncbi:glycosyltransferase [Cytobacillus oceanisediminis]|uniref:glycosyltransferase n=1 Tax=Cytobacillus oceanisediminis TaxID=665099 RepID=UPI0023DB0075|nr:glycosyltransferase [Cytobacillus oceanisediminis]MDF2035795.1 glycosyltransferase [Cytobacillus oceanisediminis]
MSERKIIIDIVFNTFGFNEQRYTKEWIDNRIAVFTKFTRSSLENQTNQDFVTFVRYEDKTKDLVEQALSNHKKLPNNIQFVNKKEYRDRFNEVIQNSKEFFKVRLDSDDMYHNSFIQQLHDYKPKKGTEILINQKGYIYDSLEGRLATYYYKSPPFYTFVYNTEDYLNGTRYKTPGGHAGAIQLKHEILDGSNYMVVVHSKNNSTKFSSRWRQDMIDDQGKVKNILRSFGV